MLIAIVGIFFFRDDGRQSLDDEGLLVRNIDIHLGNRFDASRGGGGQFFTPVIAVDVTPSVEFAENAASGLPLSGPEVLRGLRKHSAHGTQAPHLVNLLIRSQLLHHVTIMRELRSQADLYLQPDVSRYSFIHYHRHRDIAALAYAQTIASARAWLATDRDRHEP